MGKLKSLITGAVLGAGGMYVGLQYHVLQAEEGFLVVPRSGQQRLQDAYADIRDWDAASWSTRPRLTLAVTDYGRSDLITEGVKSDLLDDLRESLLLPQRQPAEQSRLNDVSRGWEPSSTTSTPLPATERVLSPDSEPASPPVSEPSRRGFLPLADLFGIGSSPPPESSTTSPPVSDVTPVMPAGIRTPRQVEILPSPGDVEELNGPADVQLGPTAPLPGSKPQIDRRRTDAAGGWEPLTAQPF